MRPQIRLQEREAKLSPTTEPPLRILLVDKAGRWWERDEEINPETIDPGTRLVVLHYRATKVKPCA